MTNDPREPGTRAGSPRGTAELVAPSEPVAVTDVSSRVVSRTERFTVPLRHLLEEVHRTREQHSLVLQRRRPSSPQVAKTRRAALRALENYVSGLHARRLPVPPKLHRDLTMLRTLCAEAGPRGL